MSDDQPTGSDSDGRAPDGKFASGNKFSQGNPHAKRVNQILAALMEACDPERIKAAALKLLEMAEMGDRFALAELLDRTIGKPSSTDILQRIEAIEAQLGIQEKAQ